MHRMMRTLAVCLFVFCAVALAQPTGPDGVGTLKIDGPSPIAYETLYFYDASNRIDYWCKALAYDPFRRQTSLSIAAVTNANPAELTVTGHGLSTDIRPEISIRGGTGNWTAINGSYFAVVVDADTLRISLDSSGLGAVAGTLTMTTTAPRMTVAEWSVQKYVYDASSNLKAKVWLRPSAPFAQKCTDGASATTNIQ